MPLVASAPANLIVQTRIQANEANRSIEIVAESDDVRRSSKLPLDGGRALRSWRIEFRDPPDGKSTLAAVLRSSRSVLAITRQTVDVVPIPLSH
jgi:hypothetical protein